MINITDQVKVGYFFSMTPGKSGFDFISVILNYVLLIGV